jgi:hypothetical protein
MGMAGGSAHHNAMKFIKRLFIWVLLDHPNLGHVSISSLSISLSIASIQSALTIYLLAKCHLIAVQMFVIIFSIRII